MPRKSSFKQRIPRNEVPETRSAFLMRFTLRGRDSEQECLNCEVAMKDAIERGIFASDARTRFRWTLRTLRTCSTWNGISHYRIPYRVLVHTLSRLILLTLEQTISNVQNIQPKRTKRPNGLRYRMLTLFSPYSDHSYSSVGDPVSVNSSISSPSDSAHIAFSCSSQENTSVD